MCAKKRGEPGDARDAAHFCSGAAIHDSDDDEEGWEDEKEIEVNMEEEGGFMDLSVDLQ